MKDHDIPLPFMLSPSMAPYSSNSASARPLVSEVETGARVKRNFGVSTVEPVATEKITRENEEEGQKAVKKPKLDEYNPFSEEEEDIIYLPPSQPLHLAPTRSTPVSTTAHNPNIDLASSSLWAPVTSRKDTIEKEVQIVPFAPLSSDDAAMVNKSLRTFITDEDLAKNRMSIERTSHTNLLHTSSTSFVVILI